MVRCYVALRIVFMCIDFAATPPLERVDWSIVVGCFFSLHIHACVFTLHIHDDAFSHSGFSFGIPCECVYICFWHGGFCVVQIRIALTLCLFIWYVCVCFVCSLEYARPIGTPKGGLTLTNVRFFPHKEVIGYIMNCFFGLHKK